MARRVDWGWGEAPRAGRKSAAVRALILAMTAVALLVVVGLAYLARVTSAVGREATGVITNALPSAEMLSDARTALRHLDSAMDHALLQRIQGQPVDRTAIDSDRRELGDMLGAYSMLPAYPSEVERYKEVKQQLARLDADIEHTISLLRAGDLREAHTFENGDWIVHGDQLDDSIRNLFMFNVSHLKAHAEIIDQTWRLSLSGTIALGILSVLLSALAAALAVRGIQRSEQMLHDRADELEMFAGRVAHDLMSPLGAVSIALQVAEERSEDAQIVRLSGRGLSAMRRLQLTVHTLLEFARAGGRPAPGEASVESTVKPLLDELRPVAEEAQVRLTVAALPAARVGCPSEILTLLLSKLLRNAIEHMGDAAVRLVELDVTTHWRSVRFEVRDSGPGVAPGEKERVFEPLVRSTGSGALGFGLDLATVKRLAEAYGGRVGWHPAKPSGSIFWLELPPAERAAGLPPPSSEPSSPGPDRSGPLGERSV